MSNIKYLIILLVLGVSACEVTDLDLQEDPNAVSPENASADDLFTSIQGSFEGIFNGSWGFTSGITRMTALTPFSIYDYVNATQPQNYNAIWTNAYANLFPDVDALITIGEEIGLDVHVGAAKIMKAYALTTLVDMFGNVPNSEAGNGTDIISPIADNGSDVYAAANALLDEAIATLEGTTAPAITGDVFYQGNAAKWATLAKTLKLRMALTTRLVNGSAAAEIDAIVSAGDLIDDPSEDFQANFATKRDNPNSRHPRYNEHYETTDGGYLGNYFMWLLVGDKIDADENTITDPRLRFYFYRQVKDANVYGTNEYSCHFTNLPDQTAKPAHYNDVDPRLPYCVLPSGYWGRDHINGEGIPPDGNLRTVYGLYPAGGQFDDDTYGEAQQAGTTGGLGAGIHPIVLSSFVYFMRAEAALTLGTSDDAREMLEAGIRASIDKVISFTSLVPATMSREIEDPITGETNSVEDIYVPTAEDIDEYVTFVLDAYDAADEDGKLDVIMKEYMIALWGNGIDSYNNYRRTGKPDNMAPTLEPGPGPFIRSAFLPANHVNLNANATQKELTEQVFWDTNSADFVY